jgi:hypothetical protein
MTTVLDKAAIKAKYAAERGKRMRPDGNDQYQRLSGKFASLAADPYTPFTERVPVADHVTFAFVGAGMSGFWNNEGQGVDEKFRRSQGHPSGAEGFFRHIDAWRRSGDFAGLIFRK